MINTFSTPSVLLFHQCGLSHFGKDKCKEGFEWDLKDYLLCNLVIGENMLIFLSALGPQAEEFLGDSFQLARLTAVAKCSMGHDRSSRFHNLLFFFRDHDI